MLHCFHKMTVIDFVWHNNYSTKYNEKSFHILLSLTSFFDSCENRIGPGEIIFNHNENKIGLCEIRII